MGFRCWLLVITFVLSMGFRCELAGAHGRWQLLQSLEAADDGVCTAVVSPQGYECQEYEVKTQDGYILTMHRIPQGRGGGRAGKRQPVLLQHGVLMDGLTWLLNPPQQSLAFVLADNGFDVWITHGRGTRWSRRHESLDTSDPVGHLLDIADYEVLSRLLAYWAWSWDELASFDLPATVGFVVRQTGQKLHYVGHSMMLGALGVAEFDPKGYGSWNQLFGVRLRYAGVNCYDLMASFTAFRRGVITKYDHGSSAANMAAYGQSSPPEYHMSNIPHHLPLLLSYGGGDMLSDVKDVQLLLNDLSNHDADKLVAQLVKEYAHLDFVMG
ncbi:Triacylglycerol lipase [Musa troglodytarum]|uniref:Triacylglycerol lipase n=1 Tax=Musa troglodytarum TaxID=320322 RepID=A0A9E7GRJ3_9LILI|nr:Triacylglycerol lipase [Musa troglodytarum]